MGALQLPVIPELPAGYTVTATDLNNLSYACAFLMGKPMTRISDTIGGTGIGGQGTTGNDITKYAAVHFNNTYYDVDSEFSGSANYVTIQTPGWYKVRYSLNVSGNTNTFAAVVVSTTGANNPGGSGVVSTKHLGSSTTPATTSAGYLGASGMWPFYLYTGDILQVYVVCSNGASGAQTGTTAISGGSNFHFNPGSEFSTEWVSAG